MNRLYYTDALTPPNQYLNEEDRRLMKTATHGDKNYRGSFFATNDHFLDQSLLAILVFSLDRFEQHHVSDVLPFFPRTSLDLMT